MVKASKYTEIALYEIRALHDSMVKTMNEVDDIAESCDLAELDEFRKIEAGFISGYQAALALFWTGINLGSFLESGIPETRSDEDIERFLLKRVPSYLFAILKLQNERVVCSDFTSYLDEYEKLAETFMSSTPDELLNELGKVEDMLALFNNGDGKEDADDNARDDSGGFVDILGRIKGRKEGSDD